MSKTAYDFETTGEALLYLADCNIATLEMLCERTRTSKSDVARARSIAALSVAVCVRWGVETDTLVERFNRATRGAP